MYARYLFIAVVALTIVPLFSLRNNSSIGSVSFFSERFNHGFRSFSSSKLAESSVAGVPSPLMKLYHTYEKENRNMGGNSKRIPTAFYCYTGQGTQENNAIFFNLSASQIPTDESILAAEIRVTVENIGSKPPLPWSGHLVLFDQFNQKPVQSARIQGGGVRSVVFPVLSLVKRWISSSRLNRGVDIRLQGDHPENEASLKVTVNSAGAGEDSRPLLVVQTQSQPREEDALLPFESQSQWSHVKPKLRHHRSIRDKGPCSRRRMRVELRKTMKWQYVIIPRFYEAYRCAGVCRFPLGTNVNPTDYAIIRAILYSAGRDQGTGEPCCVPIKLRGISAIEYHQGEFQMLYHKDMVVEECGCR